MSLFSSIAKHVNPKSLEITLDHIPDKVKKEEAPLKFKRKTPEEIHRYRMMREHNERVVANEVMDMG